MKYPTLTAPSQQRIYTTQFTGIERRPGAADGTLNNTENVEMWANSLITRKPRVTLSAPTNAKGLAALEGLAWVQNKKLYYKGNDTGVTVTDGDKQIVCFGAYLIVFPDGAYYNTADATDKGTIDRTYESTGNINYQVCRMDGTLYDDGEVITSDTAPTTTETFTLQDGQLWINTGLEVHAMYRWSEAYNEWQDVLTVYLRIGATGIGKGLQENDAVTLSGCAGTDQISELNGSVIIKAAGNDYIVIVGIVDQLKTQTTGKVKCDRKAPKLDFVVNCANRLWGCFRGESDDGQQINEIYATALGDFKNWTRYGTTADSSYAISVGSEGPWTGAVSCNNYPYFFKEKTYYRVYGTKPSDYQSQEVICEGVKEGCAGSVTTVMGSILYVSRQGVMLLDTQPSNVSEALGQHQWSDAHAIGCGQNYYVSMKDENNERSLYVLDTGTGKWMRQDGLNVKTFVRTGDCLLALCADGKVIDLRGAAQGTAEESVGWSIETNDFGYELADDKYISRFNIRMTMGRGARADLWLKYDDDPVWTCKGHMISSEGTKSYTVPVVPRRCDRVRMRITGQGQVTIRSIDRMMTAGSDARREEGGSYHG